MACNRKLQDQHFIRVNAYLLLLKSPNLCKYPEISDNNRKKTRVAKSPLNGNKCQARENIAK